MRSEIGLHVEKVGLADRTESRVRMVVCRWSLGRCYVLLQLASPSSSLAKEFDADKHAIDISIDVGLSICASFLRHCARSYFLDGRWIESNINRCEAANEAATVPGEIKPM